MKGAECLLRTLAVNGIDICFMNPGTSEMQFVAALDRVPEVRGVLCLFEGVCSGAADGYARMTRRPAATLLHLGPGLANGLANFHNARKARSPIVSIVGEHSTQHLKYDAPLSADIEAFARSVSSSVRTVASAGEMGSAAAQAIAGAKRAPGQISMLIVPADFSWSEAGSPGGVVAPVVREAPNGQTIGEIAKLLHSGRRAGLLLSGSALLEPGLKAAGQLAAKTGVRIFANRNAARLPSGRGRFRPDRIPYFPEPAEEMLSDLGDLILVEAQAPVSFFGYPGRRSYLAPENCAVHVLASVEQDGIGGLCALVEACEASEAAVPLLSESLPSLLNSDSPLTLEEIGRVVSVLLPENAIVVDEMISSSEPVFRYLLNAAPHDFLPVTGGSIGQGLPVAVGAAFACPDRKVVALEADGSAMYTLQALWTMARERLNVVTVIFANHRYRILDVEMRRTGADGFGAAANDMIDIGRPELDWVKLSQGLGVPASRAVTASEFRIQFADAIGTTGSRLIEVVIPQEG